MRLFALILLILSVLYLPYWVSFVLALAFAFMFNFYVEAIIIGFLADAYYSSIRDVTFVEGQKYIIIFSLIIIGTELLKKKLKFYGDKV